VFQERFSPGRRRFDYLLQEAPYFWKNEAGRFDAQGKLAGHAPAESAGAGISRVELADAAEGADVPPAATAGLKPRKALSFMPGNLHREDDARQRDLHNAVSRGARSEGEIHEEDRKLEFDRRCASTVCSGEMSFDVDGSTASMQRSWNAARKVSTN